MKVIHLLISILFFITIPTLSLDACTTFMIKKDGKVWLAKNLDWLIGDGIISINNRGIDKSAFLTTNANPVKWTSLYGSISFNQFGKEFPLGGINEKGLVIEEMSYSPTQYPPVNTKALNEFQWIQYHLDNSQSVLEVIESLNDISISPFLFRLHYMACDSEGHIAIIEFIEGKVKFYTGKEVFVPVLTNNSYDNSIKYLQNYAGFGGDHIARDSPASQERFVRAATQIKNLYNKKIPITASDALNILDSVKQKDTQWSIVYDINERKIQFKTMQAPECRTIFLSDFDFTNSNYISLLTNFDSKNNIQKFEPYTIEKNSQLLKNVLRKLSALGEISEKDTKEILLKLIDYSEMYSE